MADLLCQGCGAPVVWPAIDAGEGCLCSSCRAYKDQRAEEARDTVNCLRCGIATRHWGRAKWRDMSEYCFACFDELEAVWRAGNCCMACGAEVKDWGARIFPPERIQERDEWVKSGKVAKRFVCRPCFETMTSRKFGAFVRKNVHTSTPILRRMSHLLGLGGG